MTVAVVAACSLLPCVLGVPSASHRPIHRPPGLPGRRARTTAPPGAAMVLQVMPAPYQLPAAISREVVLPGAAAC